MRSHRFSQRWILLGAVTLACLMAFVVGASSPVYAQDEPSAGDDSAGVNELATKVHLPLIFSPSTPLEFDRATVQHCHPNAGITYVNGKVRDLGAGVNGKRVVFSYEPDGPVIAETISGPHAGYPTWSSGFFSHILNTDGAIEGDWYFWLTNDAGARISAIAYLHTDGDAHMDACQQAYITFDNSVYENTLDFPSAGVQAHALHQDQTNVVMTALTTIDLHWAKQQVEWRVFEPTPSNVHYHMLDQLVTRGEQDGVNLLFSVAHPPGWAREEGYDPALEGPPDDPQDLANFVGLIADRYCGRSLRAIEIWNEQNLYSEWGGLPLSATDYVVLLAPSAQAIKAACPTMRVVSGGLTPAATASGIAIDNRDYMEAMVQAGLLDHVDAVGVHASGYNVPPTVPWDEACAAIQIHGNTFNGPCDSPHHSWSFRSTLEGYHEILASHGAITPLWVTEFGWAAGGAFAPGYEYADDNDFSEQAEWTITAFEMMRDWSWVEAAFLWNLNFRVVAGSSQKAQWGIVDPDWEPLPAFVALAGGDRQRIDQIRASLRAAIAAADRAPAPDPSATQPVSIPEPATVILFSGGLAGLAAYLRGRHK